MAPSRRSSYFSLPLLVAGGGCLLVSAGPPSCSLISFVVAALCGDVLCCLLHDHFPRQLCTFALFSPLLPSLSMDSEGISFPKGIFRHAPSAGGLRFKRRLGEVSARTVLKTASSSACWRQLCTEAATQLTPLRMTLAAAYLARRLLQRTAPQVVIDAERGIALTVDPGKCPGASAS